MEIQVQDLIEQIKKDGIEVAENEAVSILNKAKAQADKIIADAKTEADKIITSAKAENDRFVRSSEDAIRQAARNVLITFRESVTKELNAILSREVENAYSADNLSALIPKVVENLSQNTTEENVSVILNSDDITALENNLIFALKERLSDGITLKPDDSFTGGFRIAKENDNAYYDFSAESVTEMLSSYLSPKVATLMKEAENQ